MLRVMGLIGFSLGCIIALVSAAKLPSSGATWSNMLPIYIVSTLVALIGLLVHHWSWKNQSPQFSAMPNHTCFELIHFVQELLQKMQQLGQDLNEITEDEMARRIELLLETYVLPLTTEQEKLIHGLGQLQGIEVLVAIAQGERLLNRMWSAVSDGYLQEARLIYPKALAVFQEAQRQCQKDS